jgi:hypothetical protein
MFKSQNTSTLSISLFERSYSISFPYLLHELKMNIQYLLNGVCGVIVILPNVAIVLLGLPQFLLRPTLLPIHLIPLHTVVLDSTLDELVYVASTASILPRRNKPPPHPSFPRTVQISIGRPVIGKGCTVNNAQAFLSVSRTNICSSSRMTRREARPSTGRPVPRPLGWRMTEKEETGLCGMKKVRLDNEDRPTSLYKLKFTNIFPW